MEQLYLFEEPIEERLMRELSAVKEEMGILRRKVHARISILNAELRELKMENEFLKSKICREGLFL